MIYRFSLFIFTVLFSTCLTTVCAQRPIVADLKKAVKEGKIEVYNRELTLISEKGYEGIRLSQARGEGVAWMSDIVFSTGTIELDVRGEDLKQGSFVGVAFQGQNDSTFHAVYLRPFQFRATDTMLQHRMIQFISLPEFTWRKLRADAPGQYEDAISPPPDPNGWVHMRIDVTPVTISVYINNQTNPCLVVTPPVDLPPGKVGFYVADVSGGDFAHLSVSHTP